MNIDRAELAVRVVAEDHVVVELHERRPPSAGATGDDSRPAVDNPSLHEWLTVGFKVT